MIFVQISFSQGLAAAESLAAQRMESRNAVQLHYKLYPTHDCAYNGGEWHSDVVAFPVGRADRMYIFNMGAASAYRIKAGQARLVWCGLATDTPQGRWKPTSNVLRALVFPVRTTAGTLPNEGALDVFFGSSGHLTTRKLSVSGIVTCSKERFDEGEFRTSWQFDARDTCP